MPPEENTETQTEEQKAQAAETERVAAEAAEAERLAAEAEAGKTEEDPKPEPEVKPAPSKPHWAEKRVDKLTAQNKELRTQLAKLQGQKPQGSRESDEDFQARVDAAAEKKARVLAGQRGFEEACNAATASGQETYGKTEFDAAVARVLKLVDFQNPAERDAYAQFTQACLDTGEAAKLFFVLGQDPGEASRLMELSPSQQGIALARLAAKDAEEPSKAPPPIKPTGSKGSSRVLISPDDPSASDKLSIAEFMKRRNADIASGKSRARA